MPAIYEHSLVVSPDEIDRLGHVNNLAYLAWLQAAALAHSAVQGWTPERYEQLGCGWVVRSHQIKYLVPAFAGEAIVVRTWVADMKKVSSTRRYKVVRASDQALLASAATEWAFVDYTSGSLRRIPEEVWTAFELGDG
jgi:acyl-CoA thioester hydrolase